MNISPEWYRQILGVLYQKRTATRRDLVQATSLNPACVSLTIRQLITSGAVQGIGGLPSTARRKQELLKLNSEAGYFVVVDLEGTSIRFGLANFLGDIRYRWEEDLRQRPVPTLDGIAAGIEMVLRTLAGPERQKVLAMGVSYTGLMDKSGAVDAVNLGWQGFPLATGLRARFDLPVFFGNDGFCKILAERCLGVAEGCDNCIYVMAGLGVGVGCYTGGQFLTGAHRMAGEFGHLTIDANAPDRCDCGKTGCLEAVASSPNIVRQYLERTNLSRQAPEPLSAMDVFARARASDPDALAVVERAGSFLGRGLAHLVSVLNPALIVLGGELIAAHDLLQPIVERELRAHCLPEMIRGLELKVSTLGGDSGLRGAASLAFHEALGDAGLLKRIATPPPGAARPDRRKPRLQRERA